MDRVEKFRALHVPGDPLVLFNIWDAGSARAVAEAGAKAIATGSFAVAETNGFKDGETLPIEVALENLRRIVSVTDLPVTIDMEAGYGDTPGGSKRPPRPASTSTREPMCTWAARSKTTRPT